MFSQNVHVRKKVTKGRKTDRQMTKRHREKQKETDTYKDRGGSLEDRHMLYNCVFMIWLIILRILQNFILKFTHISCCVLVSDIMRFIYILCIPNHMLVI